jgi:hypothetical protein
MTDASPVSKPRARARRGGDGPPMHAVLGRGDLLTSLLVIFPLFLIYEVGVAFTPAMNGVDFISRNLFALVGYSRRNYLLVHGALAIGFVILTLILRRRGERKAQLRLRGILPMLLEAGIYALTLGSLIFFVMHKLFGMDPSLAVKDGNVGTSVLLSCGAGVHEELVFRLGACAGGAALLRLFGSSHGAAVAIAFLISSAVFSAAHHLGAAGDPWSFNVFVYRTLAGMVFATIFYYRSLAHAAYTHAFYDIYVMVIQ